MTTKSGIPGFEKEYAKIAVEFTDERLRRIIERGTPKKYVQVAAMELYRRYGEEEPFSWDNKEYRENPRIIRSEEIRPDKLLEEFMEPSPQKYKPPERPSSKVVYKIDKAAVDQASLKLLPIWVQTSEEGEGLLTWLQRLANGKVGRIRAYGNEHGKFLESNGVKMQINDDYIVISVGRAE